MTEERVRGYAQDSLRLLEWIDTHASARRVKDDERLAIVIADMKKNLLKLAGSTQR